MINISERILLMPSMYQQIHRERLKLYNLLELSLDLFFIDQLKGFDEYYIGHEPNIYNEHSMELNYNALTFNYKASFKDYYHLIENDYELLSCDPNFDIDDLFIDFDWVCLLDVDSGVMVYLIELLYSKHKFTKEQVSILNNLNDIDYRIII